MIRVRNRSTIVPLSLWGEPGFDEVRLQRLPRRRRVADPLALDHLRCNAPFREQPARGRSCRGRQLLAEPGSRNFMDLQEGFAVAARLRIFFRLLGFRNGQAEAARELAHGFRKRKLVVQLDELDDVPGDAASEALEVALVAVDVE
jgi:hypothetical protein